MNRDEAREIAGHFLVAQGAQTAGYRDAASFSYDDDAKTFLERELGLERANQILSSRVRLWRWSYRWFKPQQKEEFRASVTPTGEVAGFAHELAEDTTRPAISEADAIAAAQRFLGERMHRDLPRSSSSSNPRKPGPIASTAVSPGSIAISTSKARPIGSK